MRPGMICLWVMLGAVIITASCQKGDWRDVSLKMDQLETDLRHDGLITIKRPDVWTENRLHTYRREFEDAFRPGAGKPFADFKPNVNASSTQVQLERLGLAADIAIAMAGGGGGGQSGPNLAEFLASSLMTNFNTATSLTEQDFFGMLQKGVQGFLQQSTGIDPASLAVGQDDQSGNASSGSGGTTTAATSPPPNNSTQVTNNINPTPRPTSRPAFDFLLGAEKIPEILKLPDAPKIDMLSPFEEQAQKRAYVQQNHLFRIGNEPDDGTRMSGYRLYYMRFMVSITPSSATQNNYSAEILLSPTYDVLTAARDWVAQYAKAMLRDRLIRTAELVLEIKLKMTLRILSSAVTKRTDPEAIAISQQAMDSVSRLQSLTLASGIASFAAEDEAEAKSLLEECKMYVGRLEIRHAIPSRTARKLNSDLDFIVSGIDTAPTTQPDNVKDTLKDIHNTFKTIDEEVFALAALVRSIRTEFLLARTIAEIAYHEYANEIDYILGVPNSVISRSGKSAKSLRVLRAEAALKAARGLCKCDSDDNDDEPHDHSDNNDDEPQDHEKDCIDSLLYDDALNLGGSFDIKDIVFDAMHQLKIVAERSFRWRPEHRRYPLGVPRNHDVNLRNLEREYSPIQDQVATGLTKDEREEWIGWLVKRNLTKKQAEVWINAYEAGLKAIDQSSSDGNNTIKRAIDGVINQGLPNQSELINRIKREVAEKLMQIAHKPIDFLVEREALEHYFSQTEWPIYTFAVAPFSEVENISRAVALNSELQMLLNIGLKAGGTLDAETALEYSRQLREQYQTIQVNRTVVGIVRGEQHFGWQINPPFSLPVSRSWWFGDRLVFDEASGKKMPSRTHEVFALVAIPGFLRNLNFGVSTEWTCDNRSDGARIGIGKSARYLRRYQWIKQELDTDKRRLLDAVALGKDTHNPEANAFIQDRLGDRLSLVEASLPLRRMHNVLLPYGDVAERMTNTSGIGLLTPKIYSIQPIYLPSHHKIKLVITGKNFDTGRVQVLVSGVEADVVRIANDHTLIAEMSARGFMGNLAAFNKRTLPKTADDKRLHQLEGLATVTVITPVGAASDFTMIRLTAKEVKDTKDKAKAAGPFEGYTIKLNRKTINLSDPESKRTLILTLSKEVKVQGATITLIPVPPVPPVTPPVKKLGPFSATVNKKSVIPQEGAFEKKPPGSKNYPNDIEKNPTGTEYGVELTLTFKSSRVTITAVDKLKIVH